MNFRMIVFQIIAAAAVISGAHCPAFAETKDIPVNCQVIVSLMELDEEAPGMDEKTHDITFYGAAAQKPYKKELVEYGFETGANVCIENDSNVQRWSGGSSGGTIKVGIDNKIFLLDYFAGGYVAVNFAQRIRFYAGTGPLLIYGSWEYEPDDAYDEFDDNTESGLSAGIYGRAGLEVTLVRELSFGAGIRGIATGLKFDDDLGEIKVEGPQFFFHLSFKI